MKQVVALIGFILILSVSIFSVQAFAEDQKIGFVNMNYALQNVEAGKTAISMLEKEAQAKKKAFSSEEAALNKMAEEFKKQSLVMSEEAKAKKQQELQEKYMKVQQMGAQSEMELRKKEMELTKPIVQKLRVIISDLAKQKGYSMVLEKNENTVLFSQDKDELTNEVISLYNKNNKS